MKKKSKKIILVLLIIVLVVVFVKNRRIHYDSLEDYLNSSNVVIDEQAYDTGLDEKAINEQLSQTSSDIEGMTQLDKKEMGLEVYDGADSDCDGLTDKEEIEVYGTDPLKCSTAGDLYSDGYKVEQGMDLLQYYEYEGTYAPKLDESNGAVILTPTIPTDTLACIKEKQREEAGYTIYKSYWIQVFGGNVKIDVSNILSENDVTMDDLVVLKNKRDILQSEVEEYKVQKEENFIIIPDRCEFDKSYLFCIAKKSSLSESVEAMSDGVTDNIFDKIKNTVEATWGKYVSYPLYEGEESRAEVLIYGSPLLQKTGLKTLRLYYVKTSDDYINQQQINVLLDTAYFYSHEWISSNVEYTEADCIPITFSAMRKKIDEQRSKWTCFDIKNIDDPLSHFSQGFYVYGTLDTIAKDIKVFDDHVYEWENKISSFNDAEETFPFTNFSTYKAEGGCCAGLAYITAKVHNTGTIPASLSYESTKGLGAFSYDISGQEDNQTLMDYGLNDYMNYLWLPFTKGGKKQVVSQEYYFGQLNDSQRSFVDMVNLYWRMTNEAGQSDIFAVNGRNTGYDYSMIENIKTSLRNGQILILGYSVGGEIESGHAVNIIGYRDHTNDETITDPDITYLYVYDNNYIYNAEFEKYQANNVITITKVESPYYKNGTFSWEYKPSKTSKLGGSSASDTYFFVVMDDNLNLYNTSFLRTNHSEYDFK